jgi:hypothetical protein
MVQDFEEVLNLMLLQSEIRPLASTPRQGLNFTTFISPTNRHGCS